MTMNLGLRDFLSMRLPMAVLLAVIVASVAMIRYTSVQHAAAEQERRTQANATREAQVRVEKSGQEKQIILQYLPAYQKLEAEGLVGDEQRLEWIEALRKANKQAGLFGVSYQLEPRKAFQVQAIINPMAQHIQTSDMKLSFGLMHEGDLMRFLDSLSAQHSGLFLVRRCAVDRPVRTDTPPAPRQANLTAKCDLSWLTIAPGKAGS
jgi:hypothetical protein